MQGAERETWEEARAKVEKPEIYRIFDLPHIDQIYMFYRADLVDEQFRPRPGESGCGIVSRGRYSLAGAGVSGGVRGVARIS